MTSRTPDFSSRMCFELSLLRLMEGATSDAATRELGLTESDLSRASERGPLRLPSEASSDLDKYARFLGVPATSRTLSKEESESFWPSTAHCFAMQLWPSLFWVVNQSSDGQSWGVGFQHQAKVKLIEFDPTMVRGWQWTSEALQAHADSWELYDGWEHRTIERLGFGQQKYEAVFVFGLLQRWSIVD